MINSGSRLWKKQLIGIVGQFSCEGSKRDSLSWKENNWWKRYEIYSVVAVRIEALEKQ